MPFELRNRSDKSVLLRDSGDTGSPEAHEADAMSAVELPAGTLRFSQWIARGMRMIYSEYELNEAAVLDWKGDTELVAMYFSLKGKFSVFSGEMQEPLALGSNQHNIFYGRETEGSLSVEELHVRALMVQFTKEAFLDIADGIDALGSFAGAIAAGETAIFSDVPLNIDLAIQTCIDSIINAPYSGAERKVFCYAKALELLVLQAESRRKILSPQPRYVKSDYDRERILFARDYLVLHMELPPSLSELSRIVGINEFKLKRGFREMFGHSVFGYLNEVRMELAKNDLLEKRKSITEIAFELGFSSVQHFSNAFRKRFGLPPSKVE